MNFIIFNPDEMQAESVGCYGHRVVRTPHMDRLADQGVRFDQAHVQHTVCTPSRCSFMTDWYLRTSDVTPWTEDPRGIPDDAFEA